MKRRVLHFILALTLIFTTCVPASAVFATDQGNRVNMKVSVDKKNQSSLVRLTIHEGRYHQVKKMFDAIGFPVKKLRREQFGTIDVQGLAAGEFRPLTPHEVKTLLTAANSTQVKKKLKFNKMRQF